MKFINCENGIITPKRNSAPRFSIIPLGVRLFTADANRRARMARKVRKP